jgi:hypothetical protein
MTRSVFTAVLHKKWILPALQTADAPLVFHGVIERRSFYCLVIHDFDNVVFEMIGRCKVNSGE